MSAPLSSQFFVDRAAIIDLVKAKSCSDVKLIQAANNYDDLFNLLFEFSKTWDCDPTYLDSLLAVPDDTILLAYDIYRNKTGVSVYNPRMLVNSQYTNLFIDAGGDFDSVELHKGSTADVLQVSNNTNVSAITISSNSNVTLLRVDPGSCVDLVLVKACTEELKGILGKIVQGSCINDLATDEDAEFNGYECEITNPYL